MRKSYTDSSAYGNANGDGHSDGNGNIHSDGDCNGNAYANTDSNSNGHSNVYCNGNGNGNGDSDRTATPYTDTTASTITDSTSLAFFGITGRWIDSLRRVDAELVADNAINCAKGLGDSGVEEPRRRLFHIGCVSQ